MGSIKQKPKKKMYIVAALAVLAYMFCGGKSEHSIKSNVVQLTSEHGSCSGESVRAPSGATYVLTAGHCRILATPEGKIMVHTEDGRKLERAIIAEDPESDLLLLEGIPGAKGLDLASRVYEGESIRTFTHGLAFKTYKTSGSLIQETEVRAPLRILETPADEAECKSMKKQKVAELDAIFFQVKVCMLDVMETVTNAMIVPGSSGGAVVDKNGDLVGVASAGDGHFGFLVRLQDIKKFMADY
jgi:hypothetical protein